MHDDDDIDIDSELTIPDLDMFPDEGPMEQRITFVLGGKTRIISGMFDQDFQDSVNKAVILGNTSELDDGAGTIIIDDIPYHFETDQRSEDRDAAPIIEPNWRASDNMMTTAEARAKIVIYLHNEAREWGNPANHSNLSMEERCHGAVHETLKLFDGKLGYSEAFPAFQLVPIANTSPTHDSGGHALKQWPNTPLLSDGKLSNDYATRYEIARKELSVSATDLFN